MFKITIVHRCLHTSQRLLVKTPIAVESIIRVDHAGELGADRIYAGQMAVLGHTKVGPVIKEMWEQEKRHKAKFEELIVRHRVRPTVLTPLWNIAGFALGAGTALLGEKAAMACTVAVESVIVEHYNDQLRTLMAEPNADKELLDTIRQFRDEEQEHHDCGLDHGAEQAPFYQALSDVIKFGCRAAISASKGFLSTPNGCWLTTSRRYSTNQRWDLVSSICIERKPVITRPLTPLETQYRKALDELELSASYKSNHELQLEEEARQAELLKASESSDTDLDTALKQSAHDIEDANTEELSKFKFASRIGVDDPRSLRRKLDLHLVLLTKLRLGNQEVWSLPQRIRKDGENLRETAERIVATDLGSSLGVSILGNAPFGYFKYKYPQNSRGDVDGAKVFFFKAIYKSGIVDVNKDFATDFQWASRKELDRLVINKKYLKSIQAFLIDEDELEGEEIEKTLINSVG